MKLYGIKNCGSVKKAMNWLDAHGVSYEFMDLKKISLDEKELDSWLLKIPLSTLVNKQGTTYKKLGLKDMGLSDNQLKSWLLKEPMMIKRPVIVMVIIYL